MGADPIRLIVVDAHPLKRWALTHIAYDNTDLMTVGEAADAVSAFELVCSLRPDVVTVDCSLPGGQGWTLALDLRERFPDLGIVILAGDGSCDGLLQALDSGASAYLDASAQVCEVVCAIRHAAVAASSFTGSGLAQALRKGRDTSERSILSTREQEVLTLLCDGRSVAEVAGEISVSVSTAKTYVARVYEKLGANNRAQALMAGVRLGLLGENAEALSPAASI